MDASAYRMIGYIWTFLVIAVVVTRGDSTGASDVVQILVGAVVAGVGMLIATRLADRVDAREP